MTAAAPREGPLVTLFSTEEHMMSQPSAPEAPALQPLDALACGNARKPVSVPLDAIPRLRGLDLWAYLDSPERAMHVCGKKFCGVMILTAEAAGCRDAVAVSLADWRLAVDPAAPAVLGIVVQDETQAQARRRR